MSTRPSAREADVFRAVADPHRRVILDLLLEKERPVGELVEHFGLSFQGVSQHLGVLSAAGLVSRRKEGRFRYYRINPGALREIDDWLARYRAFWRRGLDRLGTYLDERE